MSTAETTLGTAFTGQHLTINGYPAILTDPKSSYGRQELRVAVGHWYLQMDLLDNTAGITTDDMIRIAKSITYAASWTNNATWFKAGTALPR